MRPRLPTETTRALMLALVLSAALVLSGCASMAGNAEYTYSRTVHADGAVTVEVHVNSGRNLAKGFTGGVSADGALTINVGSAVQGESAVNALGELVLTGLLARGLSIPQHPTARFESVAPDGSSNTPAVPAPQAAAQGDPQ